MMDDKPFNREILDRVAAGNATPEDIRLTIVHIKRCHEALRQLRKRLSRPEDEDIVGATNWIFAINGLLGDLIADKSPFEMREVE